MHLHAWFTTRSPPRLVAASSTLGMPSTAVPTTGFTSTPDSSPRSPPRHRRSSIRLGTTRGSSWWRTSLVMPSNMQSTPLPATEGGADCFAGTAFRSAMADGQFPDYAFEEALFFMEYGSDDKVLGIHLDTPLQIVVGWALYGPLDHGVVEQRQSAFLRGFYGGPNFCSNNMGLPAPRPGRDVIALHSLLPGQFVPTSTRNCAVSSTPAGTRVRKYRRSGRLCHQSSSSGHAVARPCAH